MRPSTFEVPTLGICARRAEVRATDATPMKHGLDQISETRTFFSLDALICVPSVSRPWLYFSAAAARPCCVSSLAEFCRFAPRLSRALPGSIEDCAAKAIAVGFLPSPLRGRGVGVGVRGLMPRRPSTHPPRRLAPHPNYSPPKGRGEYQLNVAFAAQSPIEFKEQRCIGGTSSCNRKVYHERTAAAGSGNR
jgi:hypothetical protein